MFVFDCFFFFVMRRRTPTSTRSYTLFPYPTLFRSGGDLGMQYLGTQGDIWDAHKDMGLAALGALIAMLAAAAINTRLRRDLAWEWSHTMKKPASGR